VEGKIAREILGDFGRLSKELGTEIEVIGDIARLTMAR
jgi:hypothetical protein